jgi:hypothetical protein
LPRTRVIDPRAYGTDHRRSGTALRPVRPLCVAAKRPIGPPSIQKRSVRGITPFRADRMKTASQPFQRRGAGVQNPACCVAHLVRRPECGPRPVSISDARVYRPGWSGNPAPVQAGGVSDRHSGRMCQHSREQYRQQLTM